MRMRKIAIALAALLVLSGCAQATEPAAESTATQSSAATVTEDSSLAESETQATEIEATETEALEAEGPDAQETIETSEVESSPSATEVESQATQTQEPTEEASEQPSESPAPAATATPTPTETATTASGITLAEVAQRDSQDECWVAIDGSVYDLTGWIRQHPGGRAAILSLCGTDGTAQFLGQHGGSASAATRLDGYYLAPLAG